MYVMLVSACLLCSHFKDFATQFKYMHCTMKIVVCIRSKEARFVPLVVPINASVILIVQVLEAFRKCKKKRNQVPCFYIFFLSSIVIPFPTVYIFVATCVYLPKCLYSNANAVPCSSPFLHYFVYLNRGLFHL